jgi:hypothetical protein
MTCSALAQPGAAIRAACSITGLGVLRARMRANEHDRLQIIATRLRHTPPFAARNRTHIPSRTNNVQMEIPLATRIRAL